MKSWIQHEDGPLHVLQVLLPSWLTAERGNLLVSGFSLHVDPSLIQSLCSDVQTHGDQTSAAAQGGSFPGFGVNTTSTFCSTFLKVSCIFGCFVCGGGCLGTFPETRPETIFTVFRDEPWNLPAGAEGRSEELIELFICFISHRPEVGSSTLFHLFLHTPCLTAWSLSVVLKPVFLFLPRYFILLSSVSTSEDFTDKH